MQPPPAKKTKKSEVTRPVRSTRVAQQKNPQDSKDRGRGEQEEEAADTTTQCVICSKKFEASWCHFPGGSGQIPIKTLKSNFLRLFSTWKSLNEPSESDHTASQNFLEEAFPFCPFCITMVNDLCRREEQLEISMRHFVKARDEVLRQSIQGHKVSGGSKHPHFLIQRRILMGALESDHRPVAELLEEHMAKICGEITDAGSKLELEGHIQDQLSENFTEAKTVGQRQVTDLVQDNLVKKAKDTSKKKTILRNCESDSAQNVTEVTTTGPRQVADLVKDNLVKKAKDTSKKKSTLRNSESDSAQNITEVTTTGPRQVADLVQDNLVKKAKDTNRKNTILRNRVQEPYDSDSNSVQSSQNVNEIRTVGQRQVADLVQDNLVKKTKDTSKKKTILGNRVQKPCDFDSNSAQNVTEVETKGQLGQRQVADQVQEKVVVKKAKDTSKKENILRNRVQEPCDSDSDSQNVTEVETKGQRQVADLEQEKDLMEKAKDTSKKENILRNRVQEPCDSDSDSAEEVTEEALDQRSDVDLDDDKEMYEESKEIAENESTSGDYVEEQWDEGSAEDYDEEMYEAEEYEDTTSNGNEMGGHNEDQCELGSVVDKVEVEASGRSSGAYLVNANIANVCEQSDRNGYGYESEDLQQSDSTVRSAEDDEVGDLEEFKWGQTIRSLLSSQPDNSMPIRHLRREVVALYYAFPGNVDRAKTKEEIGYKLMKKLMKKGFQIVDDQVILKD